jgi:hypothetical protein
VPHRILDHCQPFNRDGGFSAKRHNTNSSITVKQVFRTVTETMECQKEKNLERCNCSYEPCAKKGICCQCIAYHFAQPAASRVLLS